MDDINNAQQRPISTLISTPKSDNRTDPFKTLPYRLYRGNLQEFHGSLPPQTASHHNLHDRQQFAALGVSPRTTQYLPNAKQLVHYPVHRKINARSNVLVALTDTAAKQAKPKEKGYTLPDSLGLSLYVAQSGVKSWHFRFTWLGKQVRISIGTYPETGLKEARARRDEAREGIANGVDPRDSRREKKAGMIAAGGQTFRRVYDEWLAFRKGSISPGTYRVISNAMELDVLPTLGDRQIDTIKRADVIALIRRVEKRGSVATAVKVRQRMSQVFSYAIATGVIEANPTAEMHAVTEKMGQHKPHPFLPFSEMPNTMAAIRDCASGHQLKAAFMLMIYTASRPGEVRHAEWSEIDLDAAIWTTPSAKMKMRRDHSVPLSTQAIAILEGMLPITGGKRYVFINRNTPTAPIGTNYANNVMDSCGLTGIQSPHGFRHLFSTEMNHRGYNRDWIERQLAHADASIIRDVYNHASYLEQRRAMMQEWADLITINS